MNVKRFIVASLAVYVASLALGYLQHANLHHDGALQKGIRATDSFA